MIDIIGITFTKKQTLYTLVVNNTIYTFNTQILMLSVRNIDVLVGL